MSKLPTHRNNRIVVDLNKVAYAWLYWKNQRGDIRETKPSSATVHNTLLKPEFAWPLLHEYPKETALERARRLDLLDSWTPHLRLRLSAADTLEFTGPKAISIWETWCAKQFGKKKKT